MILSYILKIDYVELLVKLHRVKGYAKLLSTQANKRPLGGTRDAFDRLC